MMVMIDNDNGDDDDPDDCDGAGFDVNDDNHRAIIVVALFGTDDGDELEYDGVVTKMMTLSAVC